MKEIWIHADSKLLYVKEAQQVTYTATGYELALFGCEEIILDHTISCPTSSCMIIKPHHLYHFSFPKAATLLITKMSFSDMEFLYQFYQNPFQNAEISSLCLWIAQYKNEQEEKMRLLYTSQKARLGFLVLNEYCYRNQDHQTLAHEDLDRMKQIHDLLVTHSKEAYTLKQLAQALHLTPQYVSSLFKHLFGTTFLYYLNHIRLEAAMEDIQQSKDSSLAIAMRYGFANVRSFQTVFMQTFGCTPKQYRLRFRQHTTIQQEQKDTIIHQFLQQQKQYVPASFDLMQQHHDLTISVKQKTKPLLHTWQTLMTVGRARLLLIDDIRKQLIEIQEEIQFRMIRFHGIFNDDMHVYEEDEEGTPVYNFHHVFDALDFVLRCNLKPFIELGFMPAQLAMDPDMTILHRMFIVSPPKDMKLWQDLVQTFLKNCINRYGLDEVISWYFEFWNNGGIDNEEGESPQSRSRKFWQGSTEEYLAFYEATYQAVKKVHPKLRIGGPSIEVSICKTHGKACHAFGSYLKKHDCMIDFLTMHIYPLQLVHAQQQEITHIHASSFAQAVQDIMSWMKKEKLDMELHITEWSTWGFQEKGFQDGCGKALYLIKSIVDTLDEYQTLGHWTFSDYTETMKTRQNQMFSDNVGLFTSNGIKKAAYQAYVLLHKLGDELLQRGENYILTRRKQNYQLLLFYYEPCEQLKKQSFQIHLTQLTNGTYEKKRYKLNKHSGSAYDVWKQMGSHEMMMEEDVVYLKAHAMMSYTKEMQEVREHNIYETSSLLGNEAELIEWTYKY